MTENLILLLVSKTLFYLKSLEYKIEQKSKRVLVIEQVPVCFISNIERFRVKTRNGYIVKTRVFTRGLVGK